MPIYLRRALLSVSCAAALCANRPPPLWQGLVEHRGLSASVQCVRKALSPFGIVSVSWGAEPEYGDARVLFWGARRGKQSTPKALVALTRAPSVVAIYMDADTRKSSERLWRSVVGHCGVTDLGR